MNIRREFISLVTGSGPESPTIAISWQKARETTSFPVCQVGCLCRANLVPQSQNVTGDLVFRLLWNLKEAGCNTGGSSRNDELAIKSEPCPVIWAATRRCGPDLWWVFLLQIIPVNEITCRNTWKRGFQLIPDVVTLTSKINHHRYFLHLEVFYEDQVIKIMLPVSLGLEQWTGGKKSYW